MSRLRVVVVALLLTGALPAAGLPALTGDPAVLVTAHRGGAAYAPENTMVAVANAVRLGVDAVEVDVMPTADGDLVVIHDDTLDRTTDCTGPVVEHTVAELRACDAAHAFLPDAGYPLRGTGIAIPTLDELLAYAVTLGPDLPELVIELKNIPYEAGFDPTGQRDAARLVELVTAHGLAEHVVVQSFWPVSLEAVRLLDPTIRTLLLSTSEVGITATANLAYVAALDHDVSAPNHDAPDFDATYVANAHALGKQVYTWTVNSAPVMAEIAATGADAIMTDYPACLLAVLGRDVPDEIEPPELAEAGYRLGPCRGDVW